MTEACFCASRLTSINSQADASAAPSADASAAPSADISATASPAPTPVDAAPKPEEKKSGGRKWKTTRSVKPITLTEANLHEYTIFDVVMPLPGFEVDLPGGRLREMFVEILKADGLDASDCWRRQK